MSEEGVSEGKAPLSRGREPGQASATQLSSPWYTGHVVDITEVDAHTLLPSQLTCAWRAPVSRRNAMDGRRESETGRGLVRRMQAARGCAGAVLPCLPWNQP